MARVKVDNIQIKMTMTKEVNEVVREDAASYGLTVGGYLSMLAMQARMQKSAISFVSNLTHDQIQSALTDGKHLPKPRKKATP